MIMYTALVGITQKYNPQPLEEKEGKHPDALGLLSATTPLPHEASATSIEFLDFKTSIVQVAGSGTYSTSSWYDKLSGSQIFWTGLALEAIYTTCKDYIVKVFECSSMNAMYAMRITIHPKDVKLTYRH
jgi:hypothetical protein